MLGVRSSHELEQTQRKRVTRMITAIRPNITPIARQTTRVTALITLIVTALTALGATTALASDSSTAPVPVAVYQELGWGTPINSDATNPSEFQYDISVQFDQPVKISSEGALPFIPMYRQGEQLFEDGEETPPAAKMPYHSGSGTNTLTFSGFVALEPELDQNELYPSLNYILLPTDEDGALAADIVNLHPTDPKPVQKYTDEFPHIINFESVNAFRRYKLAEGMRFQPKLRYNQSSQAWYWNEFTQYGMATGVAATAPRFGERESVWMASVSIMASQLLAAHPGYDALVVHDVHEYALVRHYGSYSLLGGASVVDLIDFAVEPGTQFTLLRSPASDFAVAHDPLSASAVSQS